MSSKPRDRDNSPPENDESSGLSRRAFLQTTGASLAAASIAAPVLTLTGCADVGAGNLPEPGPQSPIRVVVNGTEHRLEVQDRATVLEMLRDDLGLTGTKLGCDRGECGACTVLMDGDPVYSCSQLAVWADGHTITTVEGLAQDGEVTPLQEAFMDHNAAQCGFCTSGQLMSATALLGRNPTPTAEDVRSALVGNLCRCANYNAIVESVLAAAGTLSPGAGQPTIVAALTETMRGA
jgi:aerobic-type carbon monoxide dehydrogenase small subunit (CoxS/CutS family)